MNLEKHPRRNVMQEPLPLSFRSRQSWEKVEAVRLVARASGEKHKAEACFASLAPPLLSHALVLRVALLCWRAASQ